MIAFGIELLQQRALERVFGDADFHRDRTQVVVVDPRRLGRFGGLGFVLDLDRAAENPLGQRPAERFQLRGELLARHGLACFPTVELLDHAPSFCQASRGRRARRRAPAPAR